MDKFVIDAHKNKIQHMCLTDNKIINKIINKKIIDGLIYETINLRHTTIMLLHNKNISNYAKHMYIGTSVGNTKNTKNKIIMPNCIIKYTNKCPHYFTDCILPNSIIYYNDSYYKNVKNKIKIKINKHIICHHQWIKQKHHTHTIFLHIVHINIFENTMQNFLMNETKEISFNLHNKTIKKLYFYDCAKLTINAIVNNSITNICVGRGMQRIFIGSNYDIIKKTIFYDITKFLQKYFIRKIHLYNCNMTDVVLLNVDTPYHVIPEKYNNLIKKCTRNYNFLKNTYEFKMYHTTLNLTNQKKYYYFLLVKKITVRCETIYDINFVETCNNNIETPHSIKKNLEPIDYPNFFHNTTKLIKVKTVFDKKIMIKCELQERHNETNNCDDKTKKYNKYLKISSRITNE